MIGSWQVCLQTLLVPLPCSPTSLNCSRDREEIIIISKEFPKFIIALWCVQGFKKQTLSSRKANANPHRGMKGIMPDVMTEYGIAREIQETLKALQTLQTLQTYFDNSCTIVCRPPPFADFADFADLF